LTLKFQTVAEKTAKNFRGLLYFAAPGTYWTRKHNMIWIAVKRAGNRCCCVQ